MTSRVGMLSGPGAAAGEQEHLLGGNGRAAGDRIAQDSEFLSWVEGGRWLRSIGAHVETLYQVLSAAHTYAQLLHAGGLGDRKEVVTSRLADLLVHSLAALRECRRELGASSHADLGLAALLREEMYHLASERPWTVQVEAEPVRPPAMSEITAWLSLREALHQATTDPRTRGLTLLVWSEGDRFVLKLARHTDAGGAPGTREGERAARLRTGLYARLAGGRCRWRSVPGSPEGGSGAVEMVLTLPLHPAKPTEDGA